MAAEIQDVYPYCGCRANIWSYFCFCITANGTCHIQTQDSTGKYSDLDYTHWWDGILPLKVDVSNWIRRICKESPEGYFHDKTAKKTKQSFLSQPDGIYD